MSQAPPAVLLEHYLKTLRLPTMQREHAKLAAVCQAERADYATYLLRLVYNTRILTLPIAKQNMSARFRLPIRPPPPPFGQVDQGGWVAAVGRRVPKFGTQIAYNPLRFPQALPTPPCPSPVWPVWPASGVPCARRTRLLPAAGGRRRCPIRCTPAGRAVPSPLWCGSGYWSLPRSLPA